MTRATLSSLRLGAEHARPPLSLDVGVWVAEEVIAHLSGLTGADVQVTLEIEATIPDGAPERVVRTVTENSRSLKFTSQGFEES